MDIRQLRYFVGIADCGSLSQAALQLHVVQSALSHTVSQLEDELQTQLLYRKPRGVEVTDAGRVLYNYAQNILKTVSQAKHEILAENSPASTPVWIGFCHTAMRLVLPMLPKELIGKYPNVKFGIVEDVSTTLIEYLVEGKADIVVAYNPPNDPGFTSRPILEESVCCIGAASTLGDEPAPITFDEVVQLPLLLAGQGAMLRGTVRRVEQYKRLEAPCIMEIGSRFALVASVENGLGCTLASQATVDDEIKAVSVIARPIVDPQIRRELYVVHRGNSYQDPLLESLSQLICKYIQADVTANPIEGRNVI